MSQSGSDCTVIGKVQKKTFPIRQNSLSHRAYKRTKKLLGNLMIVMAFCEGGDLCRYLRAQENMLDEQQLVEWLVQICMALQYLHTRNILHRDLKTQNIFLTSTHIIKLGDLGIARVLDSASDLATTPFFLEETKLLYKI